MSCKKDKDISRNLAGTTWVGNREYLQNNKVTSSKSVTIGFVDGTYIVLSSDDYYFEIPLYTDNGNSITIYKDPGKETGYNVLKEEAFGAWEGAWFYRWGKGSLILERNRQSKDSWIRITLYRS